jgi:peptide/nickel transport system substrate-binding protein
MSGPEGAVQLRGIIGQVKQGRMSRRECIQRMAAFGLTAPMATQLLASVGIAMPQSIPKFGAVKAGGGGILKLLWWQGPTLLNPHLATGTKDQDGSGLFYEPLAGWDRNGNLRPILAAEIPSLQNGGLSPDGKSVIWKLKQNVLWHDGEPFSAEDVVFNWRYARHPATAATSAGSYIDIDVEKIDQFTVRITFPFPTPFWADPFVSSFGMIIPRHIFERYVGANSREAPQNLRPVGTGPYLFRSFVPGDLIRGVINPRYHQPNRPYFDAIEMKGGGEAISAARAVLQTGEYDYAWNLQVNDDVLQRLEAGGTGRTIFSRGANVEHMQINFTEPWTKVDGERSSMKTVHPTLSDPAVRRALALLVDRESIQRNIYGRSGQATANYLNGPPQFASRNTSFEFNPQKAADLLDEAGWTRDPDGIRAKGGRKLQYTFQSSINQSRQETQEIVKQACKMVGIGIEIKAVLASVFFSSDPGNPDTSSHFYSDLQMYTSGPTQPDPGIWMRFFLSSEIASKENRWQGRNVTRWRNHDYDMLHAAATIELDPIKRAAIFIRLNDLVVQENVVVPIVYRSLVGAAAKGLNVSLSGWDNDTRGLADWYRDP